MFQDPCIVQDCNKAKILIKQKQKRKIKYVRKRPTHKKITHTPLNPLSNSLSTSEGTLKVEKVIIVKIRKNRRDNNKQVTSVSYKAGGPMPVDSNTQER